jgi:hypothetical protein
MSNIFRFDKTAKVGRDLKNSAEELLVMYENLEQLYGELAAAEAIIQLEEKRYNEALHRYAEVVGFENVEVEFLELASASVYVTSDGTYKYTFEEECD